MEKKFYQCTIQERNGEQEYTHESLIVAPDIEEAERLAEYKASIWYEDEDVERDDEGVYWFFGGSLAACVYSVAETTLTEYVRNQIGDYDIDIVDELLKERRAEANREGGSYVA